MEEFLSVFVIQWFLREEEINFTYLQTLLLYSSFPSMKVVVVVWLANKQVRVLVGLLGLKFVSSNPTLLTRE